MTAIQHSVRCSRACQADGLRQCLQLGLQARLQGRGECSLGHSHPMLRSLVNDYVNPKVSNCLPKPQMITKILTALAEDADIGSSLRNQAHILENESFSDQFEVLCHQVGLDKVQMVSQSMYASLPIASSSTHLISLSMVLMYRSSASRPTSKRVMYHIFPPSDVT